MTTTAPSPLHVVVGAGQIGPQVAERLLGRGLRVRLIRRGAANAADVPTGAEVVSANVADPAAAAEAMRGAAVVYHCANPRYHRWPAELLPLARGISSGATRVGARLVALDNLYMYGIPDVGPMAEDSPVAPRSRKGALRAEAAALLLAAHARGDLRVTIARASDFFGPGVGNSLFGERFWKPLLAGRAVEVMADADQPHSYTYGPDVAAGLVTLGLADDSAYGQVWHLPTPPAESTRVWTARFAAAAGVATPRISSISPLLMRVAGLFVPEAAELPEMMYQWRAPFVLDDRRFRAAFAAAPTPLDEAVATTVAAARRTWGRDRAGARQAA